MLDPAAHMAGAAGQLLWVHLCSPRPKTPPCSSQQRCRACSNHSCCAASAHVLQVLEHKLRTLDAFLVEAADRRRARGFKADVPGFGGASAAAAAGQAAGMPGGAAGGGGGGLFGGYLEDGSNRLNAAAGAAAMAGAAGGFGGFGGMGAAGVGVGGVRGPGGQPNMPPAKRQRLVNAALYEEARNNAIRWVWLPQHAGMGAADGTSALGWQDACDARGAYQRVGTPG